MSTATQAELDRAASLLRDYADDHPRAFRSPERLVEDFFQLVNSDATTGLQAVRRLMNEGAAGPTSAAAETFVHVRHVANARRKLRQIADADEGKRREMLKDYGDAKGYRHLCIAKRLHIYRGPLPIIDGRPEFVGEPDYTEIRYVWFFRDPGDAINLAISHLLEMITRSRRDPLGRKTLCKCQLPSCGAWFFAARNEGADPKLGLLRRSYCTEAHAQAGTRNRKREWSRANRQAARGKAVARKSTKPKRPK